LVLFGDQLKTGEVLARFALYVVRVQRQGAATAGIREGGCCRAANSRDLGQCAAGVLVLNLVSGATAAHVHAAQESVLAAAHVVAVEEMHVAIAVA
jgi:hypothetical protein